MDWFWNHYLRSPDQMREPYASPMRAESLPRSSPALIQTAEYDPLRDEGEAYAEALRAAGIEVKLHRFDGMIHAFMKRIQFFDVATEAINEVGQALKSAIGH